MIIVALFDSIFVDCHGFAMTFCVGDIVFYYWLVEMPVCSWSNDLNFELNAFALGAMP
jgi:hypothetical protein